MEDAVSLAKAEIAKCFEVVPMPPEEDTDTGFFGDVVGKCPLCGSDVIRYKYVYGCSGYKNGCKFSISAYICGRAVSVSNAKRLLTEGETVKIKGFISKKGTPFDAVLKLVSGRCVFDFQNENQMQNQINKQGE